MKSHASDLLELANSIYVDAVAKCTDVPLDLRDLETLRSRTKHEGISFLTITLPTFGKEFDISLAEGEIDPTFFRSFRKRGRVPAFLRGFLGHVFDEVGRIASEPSLECIEAVRQITYCFKKLKVSCAPKRVRQALAKFADTESVFQQPLDQDDVQVYLDVSRILWGDVIGGDIQLSALTPKHGPGATAERYTSNGKYRMAVWHDRLEPYFPVLDNAFVNAEGRHHDYRGFKGLTVVREDQEQPVRVIPVPKTLKTPRIIAIEPCCQQYAQQAIARVLVQRLERHPLTSGHVNFRDQEVNRRLALSSSMDRKFATLDLSSASDLVPYEFAIRMFDSCPDLKDAISACRSTRAQLPDGQVIDLRKFASMGSALCFPVEAMYFYTICVVASIKEQGLPITYESIKKVGRRIYVYGDDLIIPTNESDTTARTLHKYYCKVNVRKSFSKGYFRESCGMDAYCGEEVTPTYIRELRPRSRRDASAIVSWVAAANSLYKRGYWATSSAMFDKVERLTGSLPIVGSECAGLGKISFQRVVSIERWNNRHQVAEVKTWCPSPVYRKDPLVGNPALLKCLLKLHEPEMDVWHDRWHQMPFPNLPPRSGPPGPEPIGVDEKHLERSARHGAVALKRRWTRPY